MKLIQTVTLASASASIELASIPQSFTDLVLLLSLRGSVSGTFNAGALFFNSAASDSNARDLAGDGGSVYSTATGTQTYIRWGDTTGSTNTANTFASSQIYIPNYTGSQNKTISAESTPENNGTSWGQGTITAGLSTKSAAITLINIYNLSGGDWIAGSTISLYGILKGSDGITTAS
jgi:hypothetical protein